MITIAETAGFCFGVDRAVSLVNKLADEGRSVATLGPIIHNSQVVESLAKKGVRTINSISEALPGEVVVIRSHGVAQSVYDELEAKGIEYVDATCPYVSKIHKIVRENS